MHRDKTGALTITIILTAVMVIVGVNLTMFSINEYSHITTLAIGFSIITLMYWIIILAFIGGMISYLIDSDNIEEA